MSVVVAVGVNHSVLFFPFLKLNYVWVPKELSITSLFRLHCIKLVNLLK